MKINQLQLDGRNTGKLKTVPSKTKNIKVYKGRYFENETSHPFMTRGLNTLNEFIASNIHRNTFIGFTILEKMKDKALMLG